MKPVAVLTRWTLRQRRWSTFWWCVGIVAFVVLVLIFYPTLQHQAAQLNKTISQQVPANARAFISDTPDYFSPVGYLSSQIYYLMLPILLSILAIGLGSSLIAREEQAGTIELLLARPLSRLQLIVGKLTAGTIIVTFVTAVSFLTTWGMAKAVKLPVSGKNLLAATVSCLLLALAFGAIAFLITTIGKARKASVGIAVLVALGGYIVSSLASTVNTLKWPARFMPFHYYHPADLLTGKYRWQDFVVSGGIILACFIISAVAFRRRDIG